jgi:hypothetical protein
LFFYAFKTKYKNLAIIDSVLSPSLLAIKKLQNHFIFDFIFNFVFLAKLNSGWDGILAILVLLEPACVLVCLQGCRRCKAVRDEAQGPDEGEGKERRRRTTTPIREALALLQWVVVLE